MKRQSNDLETSFIERYLKIQNSLIKLLFSFGISSIILYLQNYITFHILWSILYGQYKTAHIIRTILIHHQFKMIFRYMPDLRHDLELSENRRKKLKKDLVKLEKRLDETPKFIPIYDPVLREKDRRYQQGKFHSRSHATSLKLRLFSRTSLRQKRHPE